VAGLQIRELLPPDWDAVQDIYLQGIATGNATFETSAPAWEKWDVTHLPNCRLVATDSDEILGWAALSPVSARPVYAGVAEVTVYVAAANQDRGVGKQLLCALVDQSEGHGIWTLQAGIFPENVASIALHKSCGFREVGVRRRLGRLSRVWRDVLLLERRSTKIGV
jgi:phosphinothricin acetyltransferase